MIHSESTKPKTLKNSCISKILGDAVEKTEEKTSFEGGGIQETCRKLGIVMKGSRRKLKGDSIL